MLYKNVIKKLKDIEFAYEEWRKNLSEKSYKKYRKKQIDFVSYCLEKKITYDQIACMLGLTKGRVWQIIHYKHKGRVGASLRKDIRKRDKNQCSICQSTESLHVHHIHDPLKRTEQNLITLCAKHHIRLHKEKLTEKEKETFQQKVDIINKKNK